MTTTEKKAEPAPSKSLDEMIENFHALLKRSPGEGVAIDKADAVDILADLISYQKSSSENAALDELAAKLNAAIIQIVFDGVGNKIPDNAKSVDVEAKPFFEVIAALKATKQPSAKQ